MGQLPKFNTKNENLVLTEIHLSLSGQTLERPRKDTPNSLSETLSNSTIDYKVDGGIENQKQIVEINEDEKTSGIGEWPSQNILNFKKIWFSQKGPFG